jgi:hypothetical protein
MSNVVYNAILWVGGLSSTLDRILYIPPPPLLLAAVNLSRYPIEEISLSFVIVVRA